MRRWLVSQLFVNFMWVAMPSLDVCGARRVRVASCAGPFGWEMGLREWALRALRKCNRLRDARVLSVNRLRRVGRELHTARADRQLQLQRAGGQRQVHAARSTEGARPLYDNE